MYDTILFVSLNTSDDEIGGILLNFSLSFAIVNEKFAIEEFFKLNKLCFEGAVSKLILLEKVLFEKMVMLFRESCSSKQFFKCHKRCYILKDRGLVKETLGCLCLVLHEEDCQRIINNIGLLILKVYQYDDSRLNLQFNLTITYEISYLYYHYSRTAI